MAGGKGLSYDYSLRLYRDVFDLDYLHFGCWEKGDELNLENLRRAQQRYAERLVRHIPRGTRTILDVGCGTGALAEFLVSRGYQVHALSPCEHQERLVRERLGDAVPFHRARFEDFASEQRFDLVLMSESAQYIKLRHCFKKAAAVLTPAGHLLVADYFRLQPTQNYRSSRVESQFMAQAAVDGFELAASDDITESVLPTLKLGKILFDRYAQPVVEVARTYISREFPWSSRVVRFFFRRRLDKLQYYIYTKAPERLDAERFRREVKYKMLLFRRAG